MNNPTGITALFNLSHLSHFCCWFRIKLTPSPALVPLFQVASKYLSNK